jgi:hypothetical protein
LEHEFGRYLLDQYKHSPEYPEDLPFYLISKIYELVIIVNKYNKKKIVEIKSSNDITSSIIKYKFWLYYNMYYARYSEEIVINQFNKLVDNYITILKLNDSVITNHKNPLII